MEKTLKRCFERNPNQKGAQNKPLNFKKVYN